MSGQTCVECGAPLRASTGAHLCGACQARRHLNPAFQSGARGGKDDGTAEPELRLGEWSNYEELQRLEKQGAFGEVFRARDKSLQREVAIKRLSQPFFDGQAGEKPFQRFEIEARAMSRLEHPYIVRLYEFGKTDEGRPWFSMEWVDGESLAKQIADQRWRCDEPASSKAQQRKAALFMANVCEAVQYAHDRGVIHRDLKPANILVTKQDEPRLCDFGFAKVLRESVQVSASNEIKGTVAYMAPEQAQGLRDLTVRVDVYALGVILYEMLTGRLPHQGNTTELLNKIVLEEPPAPRTVNALVDRDLETICLRCLEKSASERPSASELAANLQCFLNGLPITLRPVNVGERVAKWCRRNPRVAVLSATVALAVVAATAFWFSRQRAIEDASKSRYQMGQFGAKLVQQRQPLDQQEEDARDGLEYMRGLTRDLEMSLGPEHFFTQLQRCNWGAVLWGARREPEAYDQLSLVLATLEREPTQGGEMIRQLATFYLGRIYQNRAGGTNTVALRQARKCFEAVLDSANRHEAPWVFVLRARTELGRTLFQCSMPIEAGVELRKAFALAKERRSLATLNTLQCAASLCASLMKGERATNEVVRVLEDVIPLCPQTLMAQTSRFEAEQACESIVRLAASAIHAGRWDSAEKLLTNSIPVARSHPVGVRAEKLQKLQSVSDALAAKRELIKNQAGRRGSSPLPVR